MRTHTRSSAAADFTRSYPLSDIQIRSGGDGRTVEAYAAIFMQPTEISDQQGRYREQVAPAAFDRTVQHRGTRFGVFYNHAMTLHGTPSEMGSLPLGSPIEAPRADGRGLVTVTRYNRNPLADQVLESIRNGDITGQSFSGRFVSSDPAPSRGGRYRALADGSLPLVTRHEIAMTEYGPTPMPAYDVPMVLGVRSIPGPRDQDPVRMLQLSRVRSHFARAAMSPEDTNVLTSLLAMLAGADQALDPIVSALCRADCALDAAQMVVAAMLEVPDPDLADDEGSDETAPANASSPTTDPAGDMSADMMPTDPNATTSSNGSSSGRNGTGIPPTADTDGSSHAHPTLSPRSRARVAVLLRSTQS